VTPYSPKRKSKSEGVKRMVLKTIFGFKREEITESWIKFHVPIESEQACV
jgi:hypothetical protein